MRLSYSMFGLMLTAMLIGCAGTGQRSGKRPTQAPPKTSGPSIAREYDRNPAPRPQRTAIRPAPVPPVLGISHTTSKGNVIRIGFQSECSEAPCGDPKGAESSCDSSVMDLHKKLCPLHEVSSDCRSECHPAEDCVDDACSSEGCESHGSVSGLLSSVWGKIKRANPFDRRSDCGADRAPKKACVRSGGNVIAGNLGCDPFANPEPETLEQEMPDTIGTPGPPPTPTPAQEAVPAAPQKPNGGAVPPVPSFSTQGFGPEIWPRLKTRRVSTNDTHYTKHPSGFRRM